MGLFINPALLPGGRAWAALCADAARSPHPDAARAALACADGALAGLFQVLTLLCFYALVLFFASSLVAQGAELLLLVPRLRGIVGSVVVPLVGSIPDSCLVLFSGLGPNAQEEISVGVGALAGSTALLLTVPWFMSVVVGRVNVRPDGALNYQRVHARGHWAKLMPPGYLSLDHTGVSVERMTSICAKILMFTSIPYVIIQLSAFHGGNFFRTDAGTRVGLVETEAAMSSAFCFFVAFTCFLGYIAYQLFGQSKEELQARNDYVDFVTGREIQQGKLSLSVAFHDIWTVVEEADKRNVSLEQASALDPLVGADDQGEMYGRLREILKVFFDNYDLDGDGAISAFELGRLMLDLGETPSLEEEAELMRKMDTNKDQSVSFSEFVDAMPHYIRSRLDAAENAEAEVHDVEEGENIPVGMEHADPNVVMRRIIRRSLAMMTAGTLLVVIFSDPMVAILGDFADRIGVSKFYVAFVFAPLASNSAEILASYQYATRKTSSTITLSFTTILGAVILNNTLVLSVFMALIYFRGLAWTFTSETFTILLVEAGAYYMATTHKVHTVRIGLMLMTLYPLSILFSVFLTEVVGLN